MAELMTLHEKQIALLRLMRDDKRRTYTQAAADSGMSRSLAQYHIDVLIGHKLVAPSNHSDSGTLHITRSGRAYLEWLEQMPLRRHI